MQTSGPRPPVSSSNAGRMSTSRWSRVSAPTWSRTCCSRPGNRSTTSTRAAPAAWRPGPPSARARSPDRDHVTRSHLTEVGAHPTGRGGVGGEQRPLVRDPRRHGEGPQVGERDPDVLRVAARPAAQDGGVAEAAAGRGAIDHARPVPGRPGVNPVRSDPPLPWIRPPSLLRRHIDSPGTRKGAGERVCGARNPRWHHNAGRAGGTEGDHRPSRKLICIGVGMHPIAISSAGCDVSGEAG